MLKIDEELFDLIGTHKDFYDVIALFDVFWVSDLNCKGHAVLPPLALCSPVKKSGTCGGQKFRSHLAAQFDPVFDCTGLRIGNCF